MISLSFRLSFLKLSFNLSLLKLFLGERAGERGRELVCVVLQTYQHACLYYILSNENLGICSVSLVIREI